MDLNVSRKVSFRSNINLDIVKGIKKIWSEEDMVVYYFPLLLPAATSGLGFLIPAAARNYFSVF